MRSGRVLERLRQVDRNLSLSPDTVRTSARTAPLRICGTGKVFAACALVTFWSNVRRNRVVPKMLTTDNRSFWLGRPAHCTVWFDSGVRPAVIDGVVKMKLEIRPGEDLTVVVVYSAKDGSFENREIFSEAVKKDQRYKWEIEIPRVSGTATVYLVTGEGGSWAGSKDYEF